MSQSHKGNSVSNESRAKMNTTAKARLNDPEARAKHRENLRRARKTATSEVGFKLPVTSALLLALLAVVVFNPGPGGLPAVPGG
jgi:hypothetical protein